MFSFIKELSSTIKLLINSDARHQNTRAEMLHIQAKSCELARSLHSEIAAYNRTFRQGYEAVELKRKIDGVHLGKVGQERDKQLKATLNDLQEIELKPKREDLDKQLRKIGKELSRHDLCGAALIAYEIYDHDHRSTVLSNLVAQRIDSVKVLEAIAKTIEDDSLKSKSLAIAAEVSLERDKDPENAMRIVQKIDDPELKSRILRSVSLSINDCPVYR
ncbi:MAG TPA: hypothetical protein VLE96_03435 [Chlamydiales bacterium]|nr:hypothetical protein [Chlamydiales bacterium]